jgi:hypothetical protein
MTNFFSKEIHGKGLRQISFHSGTVKLLSRNFNWSDSSEKWSSPGKHIHRVDRNHHEPTNHQRTANPASYFENEGCL